MTKPWLASLVAALALGWLLHGWYTDSLAYVAAQAAQAAQDKANSRELEQANILDKWLSKNSINQKVIVRESVKLVDRPVYRNICLDTDGLRIINAAKNGTAIQPTDGLRDSR